jgi:hypothetical protein
MARILLHLLCDVVLASAVMPVHAQEARPEPLDAVMKGFPYPFEVRSHSSREYPGRARRRTSRGRCAFDGGMLGT